MVGNNLVIRFWPSLLALSHGTFQDRVIIFMMDDSVSRSSATGGSPDEHVGVKLGHRLVAKVLVRADFLLQ